MGRTTAVPSLVYEIVPEAFVRPGEGSVLTRVGEILDHLVELSVDGLVLPPIFPASDTAGFQVENHRIVDARFGTEDDLAHLCVLARERDIDVIMSSVFDHTSHNHEWFQNASAHTDDEAAFAPEKRTRPFYMFREDLPHGYACVGSNPHAPSLDLRNPVVRRRLFTGEASVLHHWLEVGVTGWRILRADAVGYSILRELYRGAITVAGDHFIVGDIRGFANRYTKDGLLDGVVNHYLREAIVAYLRAKIPARQVSRVLRDLARSYGPALQRAWLPLSVPDATRLPRVLQDQGRTRLASILAYTLPGTPCLLFGDEIGFDAKEMPNHVGKMTWNRESWDQETFDLHVKLGQLRRAHPALVKGDFVDVTPEGEEEILAYARVTRDPRETVIVAINRASQTRVRKLFAPVCDLPDGLPMRDLLDDATARVRSGTITLEVRGQDARVLVPDTRNDADMLFRDY